MKRTTVLLPDDLAYLLDRERRRRGVSTAAIVREAVAARFNITGEPRRLGIIGLGRSSVPDLAENDEHYLAEGWGSAEFYEQTMGRPRDGIPDGGPTLGAGAASDSSTVGTDMAAPAASEVDDSHPANLGA
ncbi:MAG: ribbon-helix-helix domain-containing protein [Chloroflexota bacterium]|nr:ribbon-helix-helix domain-containing protein [Chloroflexota bacterium]